MSFFNLAKEESRSGFILRVCLAFICGAAGAFAMPPWHIWQLLVIALSGLYLLLYSCPNKKNAFLVGWCFGFGYFLFGLSWIGNALLVEGNEYEWAWIFAVCGLPFVLAIFYGLAGLLVRLFCNLRQIIGFFGFAAYFALAEWLRGHLFTGFPWNLFGYGLADHLELIQILSFSNVYFLTFLTLLWCTIPVSLLFSHNKALFLVVFNVGLLLACFLYGHERLKEPQTVQENVFIKLVQPNILQEDKWKQEKLLSNFRKHIEESQPDKTLSPDSVVYIVWPETAMSSWVYDRPDMRKQVQRMLQRYPGKAYLLSGYLAHDREHGTYTNSLIMIDQNGRILNEYNKHHLVPFGEYIPFQDLIPFQPITQFVGFQPGAGVVRQSTPEDFHYAPLICYEIIFPEKIQLSDLDFIVNVTNDAWYGDSAGPYQHFTHAIYRAIETGLPVIRSANTGFSGIIDYYGRILQKTSLFQKTSVLAPLPQPANHTVLGNVLFLRGKNPLFLTLVLLLIVGSAIKNRLD